MTSVSHAPYKGSREVGIQLSSFPKLRENEIHIWKAALGLEPAVLRGLEGYLDSEEKERARRYRFEKDHNHFIAARGILRDLLGRYLDRHAATLRFRYGHQAKPALDEPDSFRRLDFNLSHSHGLAVFAFAYDRDVGIDLELIRSNIATQEIAERYFSDRELTELKSLPSDLRTEAFFLCWTRKEAYVKAHGGGLQIPLSSFSVTLTPGKPERLDTPDKIPFSVRTLDPAPQFVAAVVARGIDWDMRFGEWNPSIES